MKNLDNSFYKKVLLSSFFILVSTAQALAANLTASIDRSKIAINEEVRLSITATGNNASQPEIPQSDQADIEFMGTSSNMEIINGNMSSSETFTYKVTPKKTGRIVIDGITAEVDGKKYQLQPIQIDVDKADEKTNINRGDLVFVTAQVDNVKPYLNQQVIYTFRFFRKVQTGSNQLKMPEFKEFWTEDIDKNEQYEKTINGERYIVVEVKKAIYPTKTGEINIPGTIFNVEVLYKDDDDGFGGIFSQQRSEAKSFVTNNIKLNVMPLPAGKPADFGNLVANKLSLNVISSQNNVKAGDSVSLSITVKGKGNINDIRKLPLNLKNVKVYEDKPSSKSYMQGGDYITEKTFKYAIIPLKQGKLIIPPISLSYLNPDNGKYQRISTNTYSLNVAKSDDPNFSMNNPIANPIQQPNKSIADSSGIADIHNDPDFKNDSVSLSEGLAYCLWFLALPIIYILLLLSGKPNKKKKTSVDYKEAIAKIEQLRNSSDKDIPKQATDILKKYLSDNYNIHEANMSDIHNSEKIPAEYGKQIEKLIEEYQYIRFSGANSSKKDINFLDSAKNIITKLEEIKK